MTQPRRADEMELYRRMQQLARESESGRSVLSSQTRALIESMDLPWNRAFYILNKWTGKGWWNYGTTMVGGWFTETAPLELIAARSRA